MLRRFIKYLPLTLLGCLAAAWGVSCWGTYVLFLSSLRLGYTLAISGSRGSLHLQLFDQNQRRSGLALGWATNPGLSLGESIDWGHGRILQYNMVWLGIPFLCLATLVVPLAVGALTGFRFRLWHYLVYTALVAAQLAWFTR